MDAFKNAKLALLAITVIATTASAQEMEAIDGDTFRLGDEVIRIWGIDAPSLDQTCDRDGDTVAMGTLSAENLSQAIQELRGCSALETDADGRSLATCFFGSLGGDVADLGAILVANGNAWDNSDGSYADEEATARSEGLGIWSADCTRPLE